MNIRWHTEALSEYEEILNQAANRDPLEETNIKKRVIETLRNIRAFPGIGFFNQDVACFEKYVPRTRILLIYQVAQDNIQIIAVFHTSRDPETKPFARRNDVE
jgi:plasmid stabilization system protein ParE